MIKNFIGLLASMTLCINSVNSVVVSDVYEPENHIRTYYMDRKYYEKKNEKLKALDNSCTTIRNCMRLKPDFNISDIEYPYDIEGIEKDIPYNYNSRMELSSKMVYSLIYKGWEIIRYEAVPDKITIIFSKEEVTCRIIIYKNYVKVYQKMPF